MNREFPALRKKSESAHQPSRWMGACCLALSAAALLSATSCSSMNSIPGIENLTIAVQNNHLYAGFLAQTLNIDAGATVPIPGLRGATLGINPYLDTSGQGQSSGTVFQIDIDLTQLHGVNYSLAGLPDGRALPDIEGGALPRWAFSIKNVKVYLYLANGAFGIFIPLNLTNQQGYTLPSMLSQEIDDERGNILGKAYAVPTQGAGTESGLLLLLPYIGGGSTDQSGQVLN